MIVAMKRLEGKRAIVTAAARGIGRATAERFRAEGAEVHACDISAEHLAGLDAHGIRTYALDCTDEAAVNRTFGEIGTVDILVNAVGWVYHGTIMDTPLDAWRKSFVINVDSAYFAIRAVLAGNDRQWRRLDRQHRLARLVHQGISEPDRLWRHQGRDDRPDERHRRRLCDEEHSLQRHLPRHDRDAVAARPHQRVRRSGRCPRGLHCPPAHGPAWARRRKSRRWLPTWLQTKAPT